MTKKQYKQINKIKDWIKNNPACFSFIMALLALAKILGVDTLFSSFGDAYGEAVVGIAIGLFLPDIITLVLSGIAVVWGWKAMQLHGGFLKKGKGGFLIGILCMVLALTPIGDVLPLMTNVMIRTGMPMLWYGITNPEKTEDVLIETQEVVETASRSGIKKAAKSGDYTMEAHVEQIPTGAADDTTICVMGTLTNMTSSNWSEIELIFVILDQENQPAIVGGEVPTLKASIASLQANETIYFKSDFFPEIVLPNTITQYKMVDFTYHSLVKEK